MLKYGKDSMRSKSQNIADICRDLNCQRDRYFWTSHPALEGTMCGERMWCKSGVCTPKSSIFGSYAKPKPLFERSNIVSEKKIANYIHENMGKENKVT